MGWVPTGTRRSGRLEPVDAADDELPINGFACDAVILTFAIHCPACGAFYQVKARDRQSRIFNHRTQRFRCGRCRLSKRVHLIIDYGIAD